MDTMLGTVIQEIGTNSYEERFKQSLKDKNATFRNCAGFTKFMLGIDEIETFASPNDLSEKGLLKYLKPIGRLDLDTESPTSIDEKVYRNMALKSEAVALLVNKKPEENPNGSLTQIVNDTRNGWMYVHFATVDPQDESKVYMRPDLEKTPTHTSVNEFISCAKDFEGSDMMVVFFEKV